MLLCKDGRRNKNRHLAVVLHGLEGRADGDLRLAKSHVSADEAVHDLRGLHVLLDSGNRRELILGLFIGEHLLELLLPEAVLREGMALLLGPLCIEIDKILRDLLDGTFDLVLGLLPVPGPQLVEARLPLSLGCVLLQHIHLVRENVQDRLIPVFDLQVVLPDALDLDLLDAPVDANAVVLMDYEVAHVQVLEACDGAVALVALLLCLLLLLLPEDVALRNDGKADVRVLKAPGEVAVVGHHLALLEDLLRILAVKGGNVLLLQIVRKTLCPRS